MPLQLVSSFPKRLKEALGQYSITEFANKIGVSKQTISAYTTGVRKPKAPTIKVIADTLHVNEAWLLGYNTPKEQGIHDTYIKIDDVPEYMHDFLISGDNLPNFLQLYFAEDEVQMLLDYHELSAQGKEYIRQTMELAKGKYKE